MQLLKEDDKTLCYQLTPEEAQVPYSRVVEYWDKRIDYGIKEKYKWNPRLKEKELESIEEDRTKIVTDQFKSVPATCCRVCGRKREYYAETYYSREYTNYDTWIGYRFNYKNLYCKECAIKATTTVQVPKSRWLPREVQRREVIKDDNTVLIKEYADGSVIEEMTTREIQRDPCQN